MTGGPRHTRDLAEAAYAHAHGLSVREARATARPGGVIEYCFVFDDPARQWDVLLLAFANSPERRFSESQRALKRLAKAQTAAEVGRGALCRSC